LLDRCLVHGFDPTAYGARPVGPQIGSKAKAHSYTVSEADAQLAVPDLTLITMRLAVIAAICAAATLLAGLLRNKKNLLTGPRVTESASHLRKRFAPIWLRFSQLDPESVALPFAYFKPFRFNHIPRSRNTRRHKCDKGRTCKTESRGA